MPKRTRHESIINALNIDARPRANTLQITRKRMRTIYNQQQADTVRFDAFYALPWRVITRTCPHHPEEVSVGMSPRSGLSCWQCAASLPVVEMLTIAVRCLQLDECSISVHVWTAITSALPRRELAILLRTRRSRITLNPKEVVDTGLRVALQK